VAVETVVMLLWWARIAQSLQLPGYRLDNLGIRSQQGQGIILFSKMPRMALAQIQSPIQWVLRWVFSQGVKWPSCKADHYLNPVPRLGMNVAIPPLLILVYAFKTHAGKT
jgi:hypothetical protein